MAMINESTKEAQLPHAMRHSDGCGHVEHVKVVATHLCKGL